MVPASLRKITSRVTPSDPGALCGLADPLALDTAVEDRVGNRRMALRQRVLGRLRHGRISAGRGLFAIGRGRQPGFGRDAEQPFGLFIEGEFLALKHAQPRRCSAQLGRQEFRPARFDRIVGCDALQPLPKLVCAAGQRIQVLARSIRLGLRLQLRRPVIGVDITFFIFANGKAEQHIFACNRIEAILPGRLGSPVTST